MESRELLFLVTILVSSFTLPRRIKKGQTLMIPILALNRAKSIWGEDSLEFKCVVCDSIIGSFYLYRTPLSKDLKDGNRHQKLLHPFLGYGDICCPSSVDLVLVLVIVSLLSSMYPLFLSGMHFRSDDIPLFIG